jgi:hypothetical protein
MADWNSAEYAEGTEGAGGRYWVQAATGGLPDIFVSHPDKGRAGALRRAANVLSEHAPAQNVPQWLGDEYRLDAEDAEQLADEIRQLRQHGRAVATLYIPVGLPGAPTPGELWTAVDPDMRRYAANEADVAPLLRQGYRVIVPLHQSGGARRMAALAAECGAEVKFLDLTGEPVNIANLYRMLVASGICTPGITDRLIRDAANPHYARLAKRPARDAVSAVRAWSRRQIAEIMELVRGS